MKSHYDNLFAEQVNNIKKLVKERELLHLYIQRLEMENASLVTMTNGNETTKLLTCSSQSPTSLEVKTSQICLQLIFIFQEAWVFIVKLREQIIQQLKIKEKLKNDIQQLQQNHKADIHEREQIEQLLKLFYKVYKPNMNVL